MTKPHHWIVNIKVRGPRPDVRTICGDTIFIRMGEGQSGTWTVKKIKEVKK